MAGEERGGLFAFFALTIGLSVALALGIGLLHYKSEAERLRPAGGDEATFEKDLKALSSGVEELYRGFEKAGRGLGVEMPAPETAEPEKAAQPEKREEPDEGPPPDEPEEKESAPEKKKPEKEGGE